MKIGTLSLFVLSSFLFLSCEEDPIPCCPNSPPCGEKAEFRDDIDVVESDLFEITAVTISDKCLSIEVAAGGCDGLSWEADLLISPVVALSYPPQAGIRLILDDNEDCEAFVSRTFTFDVSPLDSISDKVWIRLEGWEGMIMYPGMEAADLVGSWNLFNYNGGMQGINQDVDPGTLLLNFTAEEVSVQTLEEGIFPFESGTYSYSIEERGAEDIMLIEGIDMGSFRFESHDSFSIDQRALDGFQYIFNRGDGLTPNCGPSVIESAQKYETGVSESFEIIHAAVSGDCLEIEFAASGCDGSTWQMEMVDAQQVLESLPVQRKLRMLLDNQELCDAVFTRTVEFDLSAVQLPEYQEILLDIEGVNELTLYTY